MPRPTHKGQPTTLLTEIPPQNKSAPELPTRALFSPQSQNHNISIALISYTCGVWSITVASRLKLAQPAFAAVYQTSGINRWRRAQR
jgi:hypothetical protein